MFCLLLSLLNRRNIRRIALTLPHTPLPRSGFRTCPTIRRPVSTKPRHPHVPPQSSAFRKSGYQRGSAMR